MASWEENLLFPEHLSDFRRNTFIRPRERGPVKSTATQLQQRLQHLRERERSARTFNRELLQQFDQAQDILREMLISNDTMKTLRVEYERYLEKRAPYWQEQFQKKSEAVHKKQMEDYLSAHLKKTEDMIKTPADLQFYKQGLTKKQKNVTPPQEINLENDQFSPHLASSWLIQPQSKTDRLPVRALHHQEGSPNVPPCHMLSPSTVPHFHHFDPMLGRPFPWTKQDGTHMTESPGEEMEENKRPSSIRQSDSGSSSQSLQERGTSLRSSQSSRTSCQGNTAGKKKKKTQHVSSVSERCSTERSSETSMDSNDGGKKIVQSLESNILRSKGLLEHVAVPIVEEGTNEKTKTEILESDEGSSSSEEISSDSESEINKSMNDDEDLSPDNREDDSECLENIQPNVGETETQTSDSTDEQSSDDEDEEVKPKEESEKDEHKERRVENIHKVHVRNRTETEADLEDEPGDQGKQIDSDSQEKKENKEKKTSEEESNDEENRSDIREDEASDSDDMIITPQVNRPRTMQNFTESAQVRGYDNEKEESETRSLDQDSIESSENDIENLLSPQKPTQKLQTHQKLEDTPKASCFYVKSFQVERDSPTNIINRSDSDESDHFYD